jgi:ribonuclease Z
MKRTILALVSLALIAVGAGTYLARDTISVGILRRVAEQRIAANIIPTLPDGLSVAFCGTGSPLPDLDRAGPCTAVIAGRHLYIFDSGDGSTETLGLMGLNPANVEAVFLTHFHSDHIDGLGGLALQRWATGAAHTQLPVYGGEGVERVTNGFNEAYALDSGYRVAHHGADVVPPEGFGLSPHAFALPEGQDQTIVLDADGVRVIAFRVDHGPVRPAFGYRVEYGGRSVVISGDASPSPTLVAAAEGADLLVHEALSPSLTAIAEEAARAKGQNGIAAIFHDIPDYHTSPEDAADMATQAHVGALALTHLIPPVPGQLPKGPFLGAARQRYDGAFWVMRDGDLIIMPASGGYNRRNLL